MLTVFIALIDVLKWKSCLGILFLKALSRTLYLQQNAELAGGNGVERRRNFRLEDTYRHLHVRRSVSLALEYGALPRQR